MSKIYASLKIHSAKIFGMVSDFRVVHKLGFPSESNGQIPKRASRIRS
jgi:hypothetical protein